MLTECNQETFSSAGHFSRRVEAGFTAGQVSTEGGSLLLRAVERKINLLGWLGAVLAMAARRCWSRIHSPGCWRNASMDWRSATKT